MSTGSATAASIMHDSVLGAIVADIKADRRRSSRRHRRPRQPGARRRDRAGEALAGDAGPAEDVSVVPGNHDAYVPGAFDKVCRAWGALDDGRRRDSAPADRHAFPYLRVRGQGRADRRVLGARDGALHGQRLFSRGPVAPARRAARRGGEAGPVPRRHDPSSAGARRGGAAQAPVRHRQFPEDDARAMAPS